MEKVYIHHVMLCSEDIEKSRHFYGSILEFEELKRPNFKYPGLWFNMGSGAPDLHIMVRGDGSLRRKAPNDPYDIHFALRVKSYAKTLAWLKAKGLREDLDENAPLGLQLRPDSISGNPQIFVMDPDRNIIEFNCESLD